MVRAFLPAVLLAAVMAAIYVMPPFQAVPSAMNMELDDFLGSWETRTYPPSELELKILAGDTKFTKALCYRRRFEEISLTGEVPTDVIDLSVVLSGHDLANSIHRPERCMVAQGHRGLEVTRSTIETDAGHVLPVTRIVSKQDLGHGPPEDRQFVTRDCMTYYFFVGNDQVTEDHTTRTLIDIKDRVLSGEAQRWAYVSATMTYLDAGKRRPGGPPDFELAEKKIRQLLAELADANIDWNQVTP